MSQRVSQQDRIVVVLGATGAGKSTFIEYATRQGGQTVGHGLQSCTKEIQTVKVTHPTNGHHIIFVDTPGFDDGHKSDMEIMSMIADWLEANCDENAELAAIIYMHRISDNRMTSSRVKDLDFLKGLSSKKVAQNVILVTTMWGDVKMEKGERREQELKRYFWNDVVPNGCKIERFEDTWMSAWHIIDLCANWAPSLTSAQRNSSTPDTIQLPFGRMTKKKISKGMTKDGDLAMDRSEMDIIILIVGLTGVGKSTFINTVAGKTVAPVGHDLTTCTDEIQHFIVPYPNDPTRRVVFVDTPGFNDTWAGDSQILSRIVNWLARSCHDGIKLAGIIYLHDISQARIEPARENIRMFNMLGHHPAFKNVIFATTKWTDIPADVDRRRKQQLVEKYWTGSNVARFDNTSESAWRIVDLIRSRDPVDAFLIRQELVNLQNRLSRQVQAGVTGGFLTFVFEGLRAMSPPDCVHLPLAITMPLRGSKKKFSKGIAKDRDAAAPMMNSSEADIIIAVMGLTGAGKSTFINTAAGKVVTPVGHNLQSCTESIQRFVVLHPDDPIRRIIFVDTPGFDDTYLDDAEILKRISAWMASSYRDGVKLTGIIYLHDISQARFETSRASLLMFNKLCGEEALKNIVLATTKWADVERDVGQRREQQLSNTYWEKMLAHGSKMARFDNTMESAWAIVDLILNKEPVDLQKLLPEIDAGYASQGLLE